MLCCSLAIAVTACNGSDPTDATEPGDDSTPTIDAERITAVDLLDRVGTVRESETVLVEAVLFENESGLVICESLAESFPPQCVDRSLAIRNPDAVDVNFTEEQGIRWTDPAVWLLGWIENGEFVVT